MALHKKSYAEKISRAKAQSAAAFLRDSLCAFAPLREKIFSQTEPWIDLSTFCAKHPVIDLTAERRFQNKPCEESVPAIQFRKCAIVPEAELAPAHSRSIRLRFRGIGSRSHIARSRRSVVAFHFREASRLWQTEYGPDTYRKTCVSFEVVVRVPRYAQLYRRTCLGNDPNTRQRKAGSLNPQCGAQQN